MPSCYIPLYLVLCARFVWLFFLPLLLWQRKSIQSQVAILYKWSLLGLHWQGVSQVGGWVWLTTDIMTSSVLESWEEMTQHALSFVGVSGCSKALTYLLLSILSILSLFVLLHDVQFLSLVSEFSTKLVRNETIDWANPVSVNMSYLC